MRINFTTISTRQCGILFISLTDTRIIDFYFLIVIIIFIATVKNSAPSYLMPFAENKHVMRKKSIYSFKVQSIIILHVICSHANLLKAACRYLNTFYDDLD